MNFLKLIIYIALIISFTSAVSNSNLKNNIFNTNNVPLIRLYIRNYSLKFSSENGTLIVHYQIFLRKGMWLNFFYNDSINTTVSNLDQEKRSDKLLKGPIAAVILD